MKFLNKEKKIVDNDKKGCIIYGLNNNCRNKFK